MSHDSGVIPPLFLIHSSQCIGQLLLPVAGVSAVAGVAGALAVALPRPLAFALPVAGADLTL